MIRAGQAILACAILLFASISLAATEASGPMESLRNPIDRIIEVLNDPDYRGPSKKKKQRDAIWEIARSIFDFTEISKRAIGRPWLSFSNTEKDEFTSVFSEFLGNTYIDKLQGEYANETIEFQKELVKGDIALVRTKLRREASEIPIDYRMKNIDGNWKVYDIIVENGVSLVKNYRVQFSSILQKETPSQLIERLEKKLIEDNTQISATGTGTN